MINPHNTPIVLFDFANIVLFEFFSLNFTMFYFWINFNLVTFNMTFWPK